MKREVARRGFLAKILFAHGTGWITMDVRRGAAGASRAGDFLMAHEIIDHPHPNIYGVRFTGQLEYDDMMPDPGYELDSDKPIWLVFDMGELANALPPEFLEGAKKSLYVHPNLQHLGLYLPNPALQLIARMVVRLTGVKRLTLYPDYAAALADAIVRAEAAGM